MPLWCFISHFGAASIFPKKWLFSTEYGINNYRSLLFVGNFS